MSFPLLPFIGFAVATSVTPGPNNVMVAASSAHHGLRATLPQMFGIGVGFALMILIVGIGLGGPLALYPGAHTVMRWVGVAWLLVLAWQIATAAAPGQNGGRPLLGFLGGALFQWINPKAWLLAVAVATAWTSPGAAVLPQVGLAALIFFLICVPNFFAWAALGAGAARLLHSPLRLRCFNLVMAALLVVSMVPVIFGE